MTEAVSYVASKKRWVWGRTAAKGRKVHLGGRARAYKIRGSTARNAVFPKISCTLGRVTPDQYNSYYAYFWNKRHFFARRD
jgi:hypothetical protein